MTSPFATLDDRSLINLALRGNPEYFSALMDRHMAVIRKRIHWMLQNEADPEDLVQEVVIKVWRHLATFRWESSFRTWLMRVAVNEVLQSFRHRQRHPQYRASDALLNIASSADSPHEALARAQTIQTVRNAVMEMLQHTNGF